MYTQVLQYHLLPHVLDTTNMTAGQSLTTKLEGRDITVASMSAQAGVVFPFLDSGHLPTLRLRPSVLCRFPESVYGALFCS